MSMPLLEVKNVKKTYTLGKNIQVPALKGVSLAIEEKEFVAIAGPSGSGKSTLLHILGALDTPDQGNVLLDGEDITRQNAEALSSIRLKKLGFVFQAYNLINTLTALENVEYIMLLQGVSKAERKKRSENILMEVGLKDFLNRFPHEMSGGQQQRVAVARAIASSPKIILADEPTANLDSKTAESLLELMLNLNATKGTTFVFSTHDALIMKKARRLITLKDGEITL
jgi:putative ABC transport system ATP-binding protein